MWRVEPAPTQTRSAPSSVRSRRTCAEAGAGNGQTAPGIEPGDLSHALGSDDRDLRHAERGGDLAGSGAAISGHEREHRLADALEHERLHDPAEIDSDRARRVGSGGRAGGELLEPRPRRRPR